MKNWRVVLVVLGGLAGVILISAFGATSAGTQPYKPDHMASWVQAVGSIVAIVSAIWIAGSQHRADVTRREKDDVRSKYLLEAELAWLSTDVVGFLNQFRDIKAGYPIEDRFSEDDARDLLDRLSWCRQRARHKEQLWMVGQLRSSLMDTVRVVRSKMAHPLIVLTDGEVKSIDDLRRAAVEVADLASRGESILNSSSGA